MFTLTIEDFTPQEKKSTDPFQTTYHTPQPQSTNHKVKLLSNEFNQQDFSKLYRNFINNHNLEIKTILQYQKNYRANNYKHI